MNAINLGFVRICNRGFVFLLLFVSYFSIANAEPVEVKPSQQKNLSSPGGRFVFGQISDFRRDQFMLDTQTGRLWVMTVRNLPQNTDGTQPSEGVKFLDPIPYADSEGSLFGRNKSFNLIPPNN